MHRHLFTQDLVSVCSFCAPQPLASTLPARLQKRRTDLEHPAISRSTAAADVLAEYTTQQAEESDGSESEREAEEEELAQNSDSAVGK